MKLFFALATVVLASVALAAAPVTPPAGGSGATGVDAIDRLLQPGNLAASSLLALNVIGFIKGWLVPAWVFKAEKERADRMEERAWKATEALARSVDTVARTSEAVLTHQQKAQP